MRKPFSIALLFMFCLSADVFAQKPVNLKVIIQPTDSLGNTCKITSDGAGPYVHGQAGVSASFDTDGFFSVNFQTGKNVQRTVTFDYSSPYTGFDSAPPQDAHAPTSGTYPRAYLGAIPEDSSTYIPAQNLPIGSSECLQLSWHYTLNDANKTQWRHNFRRTSSTDGLDVVETSYAVLTRIDANTWEVEPVASAPCNNSVPAPALARLKDTPTVSSLQLNNDGLYYLPFKLTLIRK